MADAPWPRCEKCGHVRPPHALVKRGTGLICADRHLCFALRTGEVGPEGLQPRPGPTDEPEAESDVTPVNGVTPH